MSADPTAESGPRSHPRCWTGTEYDHRCHKPSGRACLNCGQPAGTPWGPLWCPDCDVIRLDRIGAAFEGIESVFPPADGAER